MEAAYAEGVQLKPGTRVEVRTRFEGRWTRGFEISAVVDDDRYQIRRLSDGTVLPTAFAAEEVRRERRQGLWWY